MPGASDLMTPRAASGARRARRCACAPRWPRWPRRSTTPCRPSGRTTCASGPGCASLSTGAPCGAGSSRPTSDAGRRRRSLPLKSWLGWGPPAGAGRAGRWAAWRWAGPASFFLRVASPADDRARAARSLPGRDVGRRGAVPTGEPRARPRDGAHARAGRRRWCACRRPPISSTSCCPSSTTRPSAPATAASSCWSPRPGGRSGSRPAWCGGATRPRRRGTRRGRDGPSWSGAGPAPGPRCRGWPPPSCSTRTTPPTGRRVRPPTARSRCCSSGPVGRVPRASWSRPSRRSRWRRAAGLRTVALPAHRGARGLAGARTGGPPGRRPAHGDVLRGVRAAGPVGAATTRGAAARGPLVCVYNRTGGARLLACRHCGELARCARCGAAAARPRDEEVLRCPRCGETRPCRLCARAGGLRMKTLRAGSEPAARGAGGAARAWRWARWPVRPRCAAGAHERCSRRRPCSSAPKPCCTGSAVPPPWPSSTSICTCWRPGSPRPRTPWRSSCAPPGSSGAAASGPPWARVQVQTRVPEHPVLGRRRAAESPPGYWRRRWRSAVRRRCRRSPRWRSVSGAAGTHLRRGADPGGGRPGPPGTVSVSRVGRRPVPRPGPVPRAAL